MADKKKKVPVIAISVGMADMPKGKKGPMKMAMGGMANGKPHMYSNGGSVTDNLPNKGLKALAKTEAGKKAVRNMGFNI